MKFSFDSEGYRNNLASELHDQRSLDKEGARKKLEDERKTLQYKVSQDLKIVKQKLDKKYEERGIEKPFFRQEKITTEEVKIEGSDGIEHLLEVQTIDISDQIPDEIKLMHDIYRIAVIDSQLSHLDIGIDKNLSVTKNPYLLLENFLRSEFDCELAERFENIYGIFLDTITDGKIKDPHFFKHVAGIWPNGYLEYLAGRYPDRKERLEKQYPHESESVVVTEAALDVDLLRSDNLWVSSRSGTSYQNGFNPTLLIDANNPRFQNEVRWYSGRDEGQSIENEIQDREFKTKIKLTGKQMTEIALEFRDASARGTNVQFKKETPWLLIADQIIDPYHGRLIKIREKNSTDSSAVLQN